MMAGTTGRQARRALLGAGLAAALIAAGPLALAAQEAAVPAPVLSVSGQGMAMVAPDFATISVGVSSRAKSATEAMTMNSRAQAQVIEALKSGGVGAEDIRTSGLNLSPQMRYAEGRAPVVEGYLAQNMVTIRVLDLSRLGAVLDSVVGAGANEINGISFMRQDMQAAEDEARAAAVADARHRAEVLASAAGVTLGPVLMIQDGQSGYGGPQPVEMRAMAMKDSAEVPIEAGNLQVNATVEMRFALSPAQGN